MFKILILIVLFSNSLCFLSSMEPEVCDMSTDLTLVPGTCHQFIRCSNGIKIKMNCPEPLHWDEKIKTCNYPHLVGCVPSHPPTTTTKKYY